MVSTEEQSPAEKPATDAAVERRAYSLGRASGTSFPPAAGTVLNQLVPQMPALAVLPKVQPIPWSVAPALQLLTDELTRPRRMLDQFLNHEVARQRRMIDQLVTSQLNTMIQGVLRSVQLYDFPLAPNVFVTSRLVKVYRPLQDSLRTLLEGIFDQWSQLARLGSGLAQAFARAALLAAERARKAVLIGDRDEVDAFILNWLEQEPTSCRREAVEMVLLDGAWMMPADDDDPDDVVERISALTARQIRNHKRLAETQINGRSVDMLDRPVGWPDGTTTALVERIPDPRTRDGIDLGFADHRIDRVLDQLRVDELAVVHVYGTNRHETWGSAAIAVGLPAEFGERVRRKCRRLAAELGRRAAATSK